MSAHPIASPAYVRRARPGDWGTAVGLFREGDQLHVQIAPGYFRASPRPESEWRAMLEDPNGIVFVAESRPDGRVIGLVVVRIYDTPPDPTMVPRRRGHVETLVVGSGHRRRGVGRMLMEEAVNWARSRGAVELVLTTWAGNAQAEAFYRRLGYRTLSSVLSSPI
jgi:ribosomal protein S18 acetylase RimI-like enzyme